MYIWAFSFGVQKKTLAKEKHTSRSRSTPDRRRANTHPAALFSSLGTCARKLAFAQTVQACADGFDVRPLAVLIKSCICAAAYKKLFFYISNSDVYKRIKNVILRKAVTKNLQNLYFTKDSSLRSEWYFLDCASLVGDSWIAPTFNYLTSKI